MSTHRTVPYGGNVYFRSAGANLLDGVYVCVYSRVLGNGVDGTVMIVPGWEGPDCSCQHAKDGRFGERRITEER